MTSININEVWQECAFCGTNKLSMETVTTRSGRADCCFSCDICGQTGPLAGHVDIARFPNLSSMQYDNIDPIFIALAAWNQMQRSLQLTFLEQDFATDANDA